MNTSPRRRVSSAEWAPLGVESLESNADAVVRSSKNATVIANPGSGKTELLAQRAAFLLQTEGAPHPRRILALCFKRDAALNLALRVQSRCAPEQANRFDSMTFDAFAKSLLDRFGQVLPALWRPTPDYRIVLLKEDHFREFLHRELSDPPSRLGTNSSLQSINPRAFERNNVLGLPLPAIASSPSRLEEWAATRFWAKALHEEARSWLSFQMVGRLADLLVRVSATIRRALHLTYSHVFLDEFQDTTGIQYELVRSIFKGTDAVLTAVGDNKQQIMRWAMAMDDPFAAFERDFAASRTSLQHNYRSSPDLVRIQHILAQAIDQQAIEPASKVQTTVVGPCCEIWEFSTPEQEAKLLAEFVLAESKKGDVDVSKFVLIVRQKAAAHFDALSPAFSAAGVRLRNEAAEVGAVTLQDLMAEDASELLLRALRLAFCSPAHAHWVACQRVFGAAFGISAVDEKACDELHIRLHSFVRKLAAAHTEPPRSEAEAANIVQSVVDFVTPARLQALHPSYAQGDRLQNILASTVEHLRASSANADSWQVALDEYEGVDAVPLMTIHKSKGLEYHTVIFVGLDDSSWWSFDRDRIEGTASFFVAFTRAKHRAVFTYCGRRGLRSKIAPLYALLASAGVVALKKG